MDATQVILHCRAICESSGIVDTDVSAANFLDYSNVVRDVLAEWPKERKENTPWLKDFAVGLRKMRDDFLQIVESDPLCLYRPAHRVSLEFHQSQARIRYFRGGNRISKTESGKADIYWMLTHQHPYRPLPPWPVQAAIVSVNFSKYIPEVFEPKYISGEGGNPLSPAFPENGKWLYHHDPRRHHVKIACPACANAGKAKKCPHPKSSVIVFSANEGPGVLQGGQFGIIQFDEEVPYEFFGEAIKRLETVRNSGLVITETPLHGKGFWTNKVLTPQAKAQTKVGNSDRLLVSLHTIDQFSAGLADHDDIRASMQLMSQAEIEARVYGRPAAFSESAVFDNFEISRMQDDVQVPQRGNLYIEDENEFEQGKTSRDLLHGASETTPVRFDEVANGHTRIWKMPDPSRQYIIGVDVSQGLRQGDASCASVLEMRHVGYDFSFDLVAQCHGWMNPRQYATEVVKLALFYNGGLLAIERNGPGDECIRSCKEWGYWNLFRDVSDPTQAEFSPDADFGVHTNRSTKGQMIAILQDVIKNRKTGKRTIEIRCDETLDELGCYEQQQSDKSDVIKFGASTGMHDDRVMSLALAVYVAKTFPVYDYDAELWARKKAAMAHLKLHEREIWDAVHKEDQEREQGFYG